MRAILKIGYQMFLLSNDSNLGVIADALSKGKAVVQRFENGRYEYFSDLTAAASLEFIEDSAIHNLERDKLEKKLVEAKSRIADGARQRDDISSVIKKEEEGVNE